MSSRDYIVKLNIGGVKFDTTKATLESRGENFFTSLLSERVPSLKDSQGRYFIDRDGRYFAPILQFLRTGYLEVERTSDMRSVLREAQFYGVDIGGIDGDAEEDRYVEVGIRRDYRSDSLWYWSGPPHFEDAFNRLRSERPQGSTSTRMDANCFSRILGPDTYTLKTTFSAGDHGIYYIFQKY
eukprot:GILK01013006.1.p1 GENE.GILK01013006.1~~GILK01013006.1.p1  ORF type:complete len:183 (-),score=4.33 GILK01013006.1:471-1019(-)